MNHLNSSGTHIFDLLTKRPPASSQFLWKHVIFTSSCTWVHRLPSIVLENERRNKSITRRIFLIILIAFSILYWHFTRYWLPNVNMSYHYQTFNQIPQQNSMTQEKYHICLLRHLIQQTITCTKGYNFLRNKWFWVHMKMWQWNM